MHVFIDTNVLLNFLHFSKDELGALGDVFASHEQGSAQVHLTSQVRDEYLRNRENKLNDALQRFKNSVPHPQIPSFMRSYEECEDIQRLGKELDKKSKSVVKKVTEDITERALRADKLIDDILSSSDVIKVTSEVYKAASQRMALGNPPGKDRSVGDAINWLLLLSSVPDKSDLHLISEDGDFYSVLDELAVHPFLADEWKAEKNSEIFVYRTISDFLKKRFDGVAFSYDSKKEELIEQLRETGSFASTHTVIAKLGEFSYFSLQEVERILEAAYENGQVRRIIEDYDVSEFLNRVGVPHMDSIGSDEHKKILRTVIKEKRERGEPPIESEDPLTL